MFTESMLESGAHAPTNRRWTTLTSLLAQCALVAILIALPMIYTDALSLRYNPHALAAPPVNTPPPADPAPRNVGSSGMSRQQTPTVVRSERRYNFHTMTTDDPSTAVPACCMPVGPSSNVNLTELIPHTIGPTLSVKRELPRRVVTSRLMEGLLIRRVQPVYPQIAKITHQEGTVVLHAIIGKDGRIERVSVISGPGLLANSAVDAVKQWQYRPYVLNGEPVEVETQITVKFTMGG